MASDAELAALLSALDEQPADLDRAWRYWRALGEYEGCDIRSGSYVVRAFRAAALASPAGAAAFSCAYFQLRACSHEGPRRCYVDRELHSALLRSLGSLTGDDRNWVEWVLRCVGISAKRPWWRIW
jgi:hypothetical protein